MDRLERDEIAVLRMAQAGGRDGFALDNLAQPKTIEDTAKRLAKRGLIKITRGARAPVIVLSKQGEDALRAGAR